MCTTCGCGSAAVNLDGQPMPMPTDAAASDDHQHWHQHEDGTWHAHEHEHEHGHDAAHAHDHDHTHEHAHDHGHEHDHGHAHTHAHAHAQHSHAAGVGEARRVQIERDILSANDAHAQRNRDWLRTRGVFALNLVSSPGSGKTTLLVKTIEALRAQGEARVQVIEGDQQTDQDAARIRATGAPAVQINTGKGCHLDAHMVGHALERLDTASGGQGGALQGGYLFIENVGNLVCPAAFDLGEAHKVVILSVTEGEDKPIKYPDMFAAASLMLVHKLDLAPHCDFDVERCIAFARRVNPRLQVLKLSSKTGEGMPAWLQWLQAGLAQATACKP